MLLKNLFRCPEFYALLALAFLLSLGTHLEREQQELSYDVLRLHVVANSDDPVDQEIKLMVRDAVLNEAEVYLKSVTSAGDATEVLHRHITQLEQAANLTLNRVGCQDRAKVTLSRELFPTRSYDTFSLPGGYYNTLRVTLGNGEGHNWWCVVYPAICTAVNMEEFEQTAERSGMTREEIRLITGDGTEYILRFKLLEVYRQFMSHFSPN